MAALSRLLDKVLTAKEQTALVFELRQTLIDDEAQRQIRARRATRDSSARRAIRQGQPVKPVQGMPAPRPPARARVYGAYWSMTGPAPVLDRGDTALARAFWERLKDALDAGGWTPADAASLAKLEQRWRERAFDRDPRFTIAGTRAGRLPRDIEAQIAERRRALLAGGNDDET